MIKRRNADNAAKLRQRVKKGKIGEGVMNWFASLLSLIFIMQSAFIGVITYRARRAPMIYVKLLAAWAALMGMDYIFGFRLEYLWPTWLLVRSIYDSFRYQGLVSYPHRSS